MVPRLVNNKWFSSVRWLVLGTVLCVGCSFGFVESLRDSSFSPRNVIVGLCFGGAAAIVFIIVLIYAIRSSFRPAPKRDALVVVLCSYFSLILVFAAVYYSMAFLGDHQDAENRWWWYRDEALRTAGHPDQKIKTYAGDHRAFHGFDENLWASADEDTWASLNLPANWNMKDFPTLDPTTTDFWRVHNQEVKFRPNARLAVALDCFHLSVVTMATLGYGDIYPKAPYAKLATDVEVLSGVTLIVIALGMIFGNWHDERRH
jgi:hypothetical protein